MALNLVSSSLILVLFFVLLLFLSSPFILTTLMGVDWYLTVVCVCSSLMTHDVEHFFRCSLAICRSLEKYIPVVCPIFNVNVLLILHHQTCSNYTLVDNLSLCLWW